MESAPGRVRTLAIWNGTKFDRNYDYDLVGTPGETIVGKTGCMYTNDVRQRFPHDDRLATLGVESFMGAPLFGAAGEWLGLLVVMTTKRYRRN